MKKTLLSLSLLFVATIFLNAQDTRERNYNYEILVPNHAAKPKVTGFAQKRVVENLDRGVTAATSADGKSVYVSWRLLNTDPENTSFNVYRSASGKTQKLNSKAISAITGFVDSKPLAVEANYWVETVVGKQKTQSPSFVYQPKSEIETPNYISIKLRNNIAVGKLAVADLNGDGIYDFIVRHPASNVDPGTNPDTIGTTYKIDAYLHDGTYLWTKDLGLGTEPGVWYSPFVAYDLNGDGKAEIALKTTGNDYTKDYRNRINGGSEFLTILDGMTGKEIASVPWNERNFRYGDTNRQNRNQIGIAYLDGKTPCILSLRGTYRLMTVNAYQLNGNKLETLWKWDGDEENPVVRSQGAHNMVAGDVDGDGRDEILLGTCMLDDDGTLLWSAGLGHSDKAYLTDIDPSREGLEVFLAIEPWVDNGYGVSMLDAATGKRVWGIGQKTFHVGDGMVADIDPTHPGLECFASEDSKGGSSDKYLLSSKGEFLALNDVPPCRNWVWWDAGKTRQIISGGFRAGSFVNYWKGEQIAAGITGSIQMIADLVGDWREEIVTSLPGEIRIYFTNIPATDKRVTLMQDPIYRSYIIERSQGYPMSPVPGYYLGN
ncbi:MAG: silent information regulator protein Sir2 [Paludibacter sp.]|jgi:hypothetical protein|nr:silent information regulator protein Sir2 [Paludibacter sp.]